MSNADVLALHRAGFGDQVIVAKIKTSRPSFSLSATDLVQLKTGGVSDVVVAAMLEAPVSQRSSAVPPANSPNLGETSRPLAALEGRYSTSHPGTTAELTGDGAGLIMQFEGGDLSGVRVPLRRNGDELVSGRPADWPPEASTEVGDLPRDQA